MNSSDENLDGVDEELQSVKIYIQGKQAVHNKDLLKIQQIESQMYEKIYPNAQERNQRIQHGIRFQNKSNKHAAKKREMHSNIYLELFNKETYGCAVKGQSLIYPENIFDYKDVNSNIALPLFESISQTNNLKFQNTKPSTHQPQQRIR